MTRIVAAIAFGLLSTAAAGQTQAPSASAPAAKTNGANMNEVVCQKIKEVGSRLAMKKVCKTRAEWADLKLQDRQALDQAQVQRGISE